ncbi:VIT family protein [Bosea sp. ASV33]|uniref:VIT1/CCC1 transporter family protein n=1 Tax=Bosea sp. ASV33 TaxID=2795106 RepID=UPI0018EC772D|nr:VIT family protein [Bosea sp. ASV33]
MTRLKTHHEHHVTGRLGWLRAAVLGANDGVLSTSSLIIGVASAGGNANSILNAGVSGLVAGAMSMAAGEYVSVSSQADSENADLARERKELHDDAVGELAELTNIYVSRGLNRRLAIEVATSLMAHDPLGAHARDELGLSTATAAQPVQAALSSAAAFAVGAIVPVGIALIAPAHLLVASVSIASLVFLAILGAVGARVGGAPTGIAAIRVTFWGAFAMAVTAGIGALFGTRV